MKQNYLLKITLNLCAVCLKYLLQCNFYIAKSVLEKQMNEQELYKKILSGLVWWLSLLSFFLNIFVSTLLINNLFIMFIIASNRS